MFGYLKSFFARNVPPPEEVSAPEEAPNGEELPKADSTKALDVIEIDKTDLASPPKEELSSTPLGEENDSTVEIPRSSEGVSEIYVESITEEGSNKAFITWDFGICTQIISHGTTIVHIYVVAFAVVIFYLSFKGKFETFSWHPILMTIGWGILVPESILAISKANVFTTCLTRRARFHFHWILLLFALFFIVPGTIIAYVADSEEKKVNCHTTHAILGIAAIVFYFVAVLQGLQSYCVTLLYGKDGNQTFWRNIHRLFGILAFICGIISLMALFANSNEWIWKKSNKNEFVRCFGFFGLLFVLIWVILNRIINYFGGTTTDI